MQDAADAAAVDAQLAARGVRLRFAPALEARFQAESTPRRRRELLLAGAASLAVFDAFLLNDWLTRPEVMHVALAARGATTVFALAVLLAVAQPALPARWREGLMAALLPVAMAFASWLALVSPVPARTYDPFLLSLVLMAGNIAFPLRFGPALASTAASLAIVLGVVFAPGMDDGARPWALGQLCGTAVFSLIACWRIEHRARESYLLRLRETLRSQAAQHSAQAYALLSQTDALTGLPNRRAFDGAFALQAARRDAMALLLIDVDHFKRYNDRHGHLAGDEALRGVAQAMRGALREQDLLARFGGEEFVALLPGTAEAAALAMAERLRAAVQAAAIVHHDGAAPVVTVSVGVAVRAGEGGPGAAALLAEADRALYAAKAAGRNRCMPAPAALSERAASLRP